MNWLKLTKPKLWKHVKNWILQTLHYYCRKQNVVISFCLFLCILQLMLPSLFLKISNVTTDYSCHKYCYFLVWKWLDITTCIKNRVYNDFNLPYFMSLVIESLSKSFSVQKSLCLSLIHFSVQIFLKLN